jgi:hypothetical protein
MEYKIVHIRLNRGADLVRSADEKAVDLSARDRLTEGDVVNWWKNISEDFKKEVFKPRSKDFNVEVTSFLIAKLSDVTIYSSNYDQDTKKFRSMYVISNKNVVEMKELGVKGVVGYKTKDVKQHIVKPTKPVLISWLDAISNHTSGTAAEIMEKSKITPIYFSGFLIGTSNDALYVATAYNKETNKYRGILIIPLMNIKSVESLE